MLGGASGVIRWAATPRAALEIPGSTPVDFVLHNDQADGETQPPPCPGVTCVTWSGVMLPPADSLPPWLHLGARKRAMIEYMETVAQYARFESWDLFCQERRVGAWLALWFRLAGRGLPDDRPASL